MQQHHIFGTDGVRGRVGKPPMTPQVVMQLAQAYGSLLVEQVGSPAAATSIHLDRPAVVVGTDTRISCSMLEAALQAGFAAAGVDTVLCGVLPTPGVAYIARLRGFQAGVVVSASHNRFEDNGIKLFSGRGDKLDDEVEAAIERRMGEPLACVPSRQLGQGWRMPTAAGLYVDFCKRSLPADVIILDLEDAVAPDEKPAARALLARVLTDWDFGNRARIVRINGFDTEWGYADARANRRDPFFIKPAASLWNFTCNLWIAKNHWGSNRQSFINC